MFGKTRPPDARLGGRLLPGRGRTFADFLRPTVALAPPVPLFDFPHRREIEARLGHPLRARARVDAAGCAARGGAAYLDGEVVCFATATPDLAEALAAVLTLLGG